MALGIKDFKYYWDRLITRLDNWYGLDIDKSFPNTYLEFNIIPAYTKDRHYHTLRHVISMLENIKDFKLGSFNDTSKLELAIWFHDIIYDATSNNNEELSANQFSLFAEVIGLDEKIIKEVYWMIRVTTHKGTPQTRLEDIICDLDLREFANDRQKLNTIEVRREFSHLSNEEWKFGRTMFVQSMLNKEFIYHTDEYRRLLEDTARNNLQKELDTLTQQ